VNLILFSSTIDIKTPRETSQIRAKIRTNIGTTNMVSLPFLMLRLTSILPSIPPESYLSHQNPKVLPGSTDKPQYKHKRK